MTWQKADLHLAMIWCLDWVVVWVAIHLIIQHYVLIVIDISILITLHLIQGKVKWPKDIHFKGKLKHQREERFPNQVRHGRFEFQASRHNNCMCFIAHCTKYYLYYTKTNMLFRWRAWLTIWLQLICSLSNRNRTIYQQLVQRLFQHNSLPLQTNCSDITSSWKGQSRILINESLPIRLEDLL